VGAPLPKVTISIVRTSAGDPFTTGGAKRHWRTASRAAASSMGETRDGEAARVLATLEISFRLK
jgi:hypothetical protein